MIQMEVIESMETNLIGRGIKLLEQRRVLGQEFNIYGTNENPFFLAKDIAELIDYQMVSGKNVRNTSKMLNLIDRDEKFKSTLDIHSWDTQKKRGGIRENIEMWFVTEDGLYEILMQSRKPIAKLFKKEVKQILKQLRLTGGVVRNEEMFMENYFPSLSDEVKKAMFLDLQQSNERIKHQLQETKLELEYTNDKLDLKEEILNNYKEREGLISVTQLARELTSKGIEVGGRQLFSILRDWKLICLSSTEPTQNALARGFFKIETPLYGGKVRRNTKVTGEGKTYIYERLLKDMFKPIQTSLCLV